MTSRQKIVTSLSIFQFMANLEQPVSWIPDAESAKLMFSLTENRNWKNWKQKLKTNCSAFINWKQKLKKLKSKTENWTKKSLTQLSHYWDTPLSKDTIFVKKTLIFCKKILTLAKLMGSLYWEVFFLKLNMCVYLPAKFKVSIKF